ncbi:endoplasmic reticulum protein [Cryptococcus deuterogattii LA55]|nr:endoplasmic reticulum protein [Cryptococcus deuterogattii LA55]KIR95634.1 endoplasmic reticulum protein [Cryptococcus deuterogattii CBS 10090]
MWWPFQWLFIYVLGGLTFIPLVVVIIVVYAIKYGSSPIGDDDPFKLRKNQLQSQMEKEEQLQKHHSKDKTTASGVPSVSGWLTIRRHFYPNSTGGDRDIPSSNKGNASTAVTGFVAASPIDASTEDENPARRSAELKDIDQVIDTVVGDSNAPSMNAAPKPTYSSRIAQTYRSIVPRQNKLPTPKSYFFCVLKSSVLFLYEDETQSNCAAAIGVEDYTVGIENGEGQFDGKDGEMFSKRNAIVLKVREGGRGIPLLSKTMSAEDGDGEANGPIYLFSKSNTRMEDWYMALLQVSSHPPTFDDVFSIKDMKNMVDTIDTEPDPIPMRWFNAFVGRVFFGFYRTEAFEQFIISKIMKNFSKPMLKDLTASGTAAFEVHVQHRSHASQPASDVRLTIATTATIPTGFKPYVVNLVLAVVLKSFEGNLLVQIKEPPSNRVWYGFTEMPKFEMEIIPVVSERKIQIGMVLKAIEKQLRDVIAESVVLPNMDDLAFFNSCDYPVRGGIFNYAAKIKRNAKGEKEDTFQSSEESKQEAVSSGSEASSTTLRHRHQKQTSHTPTIVVPSLTSTAPSPSLLSSQLGADTGTEIVRTESTPATFSSSSASSRKAAALSATKKWFAAPGVKPSSSMTQNLTGGVGQEPNDDSSTSGNLSKRSTESQGFDRKIGQGGQKNWENRPEVTSVEVSLSTTSHPDIPGPVQASKVSDLTSDSTSTLGLVAASPSKFSETSSIATSSTETSLKTIPTDQNEISTIPHQLGMASTSSLISSLRSRDKKALQAQMGSAKEQMKKWSVNFGAKRRLKAGTTEEGDGSEKDEGKQALYRPREEEEDVRDDDHVPSPSQSHSHKRTTSSQSHGLSLQERLNAAAHETHATVLPHTPSNPMFIPERQRSSSTASRPSLLSSPSKTPSLAPVGISPPTWAPEGGRPTVGVFSDEAASTSSNILAAQAQSMSEGHTRRQSISTPVSTQPAAGRSMVVPRVPKRPGQVTGIGSSDLLPSKMNEGSTVERDQGEGLKLGPTENVKDEHRPEPPTLPPRKNIETIQTEESREQEPWGISPAHSVGVPPPLPPRKGALDPLSKLKGLEQQNDQNVQLRTPEQIPNSSCSARLSEVFHSQSEHERSSSPEGVQSRLSNDKRPVHNFSQAIVSFSDEPRNHGDDNDHGFTPCESQAPRASLAQNAKDNTGDSDAESALRMVAMKYEEAKKAKEVKSNPKGEKVDAVDKDDVPKSTKENDAKTPAENNRNFTLL